MSGIAEILQPYRDAIEPALDEATQFGQGCPDRLKQAIRYALLAPGKRLRPALVMMSAEACGGAISDALVPAVAVEMIHAYSLIHDDLPAMDDDDLRRGRPTTHIEFGQATAILAGDALQAAAMAHLYTHTPDRARAARMMGELAMAAGPAGLVGGQEDDLAAESLQIADFASPLAARLHLESIHRRKTGDLFIACAKLGGIAAGGSDAQIEALVGFATAFGLAFQITDDVLDYTASDEQLGKRTGKDSGRGKFTFPDLMAAENSSESQLKSNQAITQATDATATQQHAGIELARRHAEAMISAAQQSLELFGDRSVRLSQTADYLLERTS
ncbi:polyprenyl synthetase family protein [Allorhodopirellula solitaria]|uniref:Farnesyl diphosphate synthase n=1 Tax=Allorhodopirellula solitaria TaxID=2527987 RepID=A0A5C5XAM4_9BACT|nr:farnesyl diphosphate synthase [Allorhodopirellula solitaria]TWT59235.1 Farnesyl diphosphate synthase [Allorhodopirellula solitaria]